MIGRLIEDLFFLGRLGYFYHKAPREIGSLGFNPTDLTRKEKMYHAWSRASFKR